MEKYLPLVGDYALEVLSYYIWGGEVLNPQNSHKNQITQNIIFYLFKIKMRKFALKTFFQSQNSDLSLHFRVLFAHSTKVR